MTTFVTFLHRFALSATFALMASCGGREKGSDVTSSAVSSGSASSTSSASASFSESRTEHGALTQFHRWYVLYERPHTPERLEHQLEILDPDVDIAGPRAKGRGHAAYRQAVAALPPDERHAHHIQRATVTRRDRSTIALEADIVYQMLSADKTVSAHALHYTATLRDVPGQLPVFTHLVIAPTGASPGDKDRFVDAYAANRAASFLHYWLFLIEDMKGSAEPFRELLDSTDLRLDFSTSGAPITSFEQFAAWHAATLTKVVQSSHAVENLVIAANSDGYAVSADFAWRGVTPDDRRMAARTHHEWQLVDRGERFPRMRAAKVVQVEPFHPVE